MNILVTGSCGYIGSLLVKQLGKYSNNIVAVDNLMYNQLSIATEQYTRGIRFHNLDIRNKTEFPSLVREADIVINLAAIVGAPACDKKPIDANEIHLGGTKNIVANMKRNALLVNLNTNSGYGIAGEDVCTEESPLNPISLYGRSKCEQEVIAQTHNKTVCFRLATVFGVSPRMRTDLLVNDWTYRAVIEKKLEIYEPQFRRNFVHINDVCGGILSAINNPKMVNNVFNLGDDSANMTKWGLAEKIKQAYPQLEISVDPNGIDPDKRDYNVSSEKLYSTGFKCYHQIDTGISELIKYYSNVFGSSSSLKGLTKNV